MIRTPQRVLARAIDASDLSARQFAVQVLARDERTVRRWIAGDSPIPEVVVEWLEGPIFAAVLQYLKRSR